MVATSIDFDKVNPTFIDCNFPSQPRFTFGCQPPNQLKEFCSGLRAYEDVEPPIASSQWIEIAKETLAQKAGAEWLVSRIYDQSQEGSCVANMKSQQCEVQQALQWGLDRVVHMSAISLYKRIGSSAQSGAYVEDSTVEAYKRGILPLDTPENRAVYGNAVMPNTGWRTPFPADWEQTAAMFCDDEQFVVRTYAGLVSALLRNRTVGIGRAGHSILYCGCPQFTTNSVNSIKVPYPNSWSLDWGVALGAMSGGFGFDTYNYIRQAAGYGIVVRSLVDRTKPENKLAAEPLFQTAI